MKEMDAKPQPNAGCAACPAYNPTALKRLGVDAAGSDFVVALAGNPNTGKSTVFNALTGLRQHTGNWPGKTVGRAEGAFRYADRQYKLVDLPGTYSLLSMSYDEEIARDFILFGRPDVTVIVVDATRLERNLNLVLQILQITDRAVICLNLMDEARRRGLTIDHRRLARDLGVRVVPAAARQGEGLPELIQAIDEVAVGAVRSRLRRPPALPPAQQDAVDTVVDALRARFPDLPHAGWVAVRLLDGDERLATAVRTGELGQLNAPALVAPAVEPAPTAMGVAPAMQDELSTSDDPLLRTVAGLRWQTGQHFHDQLAEAIYGEAARVADRAVVRPDRPAGDREQTFDQIVTSRRWGFPLMLLLFALVFWITISGANVPSQWLSFVLLDTVHPWLKDVAAAAGVPWWVDGMVIDGMYLATAWVVSVMLPPMAIFFPLFTLLEDFGYLPRVAFNLDGIFKRAGAHGKQALSMMMGFGCNAAGVIATRVIDSPRERLIAILTNNFALCNGRWPTQILLAGLFLGVLVPPALAGLVSAAAVVAVALLGVGLTFVTSWALSRTALRGEVSAFTLELPPYRPPRIWQTIYTSVIDRTLFVLWRAIVFALPAGAVIWLFANVTVGGLPLAAHIVWVLNGPAGWFGLNGIILLAYLVALPANEIVIPTVLMLTVLMQGLTGVGAGTGVMFELESTDATLDILRAGGWTTLTAVNVMLFSLIHNPCSTTLVTIYRETGSRKWTAVAALLPLVLGFVVTFVVAMVWRMLTAVV